jgi:hypothetical protein
LSDEQIKKMLGDPSEATQEIWPANLEAVNLFFVAATQWRFEFGAFIDYSGVKTAAELAGLTISDDDFNGFQVMERAVRKEYSNEQ